MCVYSTKKVQNWRDEAQLGSDKGKTNIKCKENPLHLFYEALYSLSSLVFNRQHIATDQVQIKFLVK